MATKRNVEILPTYKELQAAMDDHFATHEYIGPVTPIEDTAYLAQEEGEMKPTTKPKKSKKPKSISKTSLASKEPLDKPSLTLLPGKGITLDNIRKMFIKLTGREPTKEEMESARKTWEEAHPSSS